MQKSETVKKLPIGIQTFSEIITGNYYYVDKTKILAELNQDGKYYFLSRPRRFGKSLFLDTLKEAFEGNKELFIGLYLEKNQDWDIKYPVIRFDFGNGVLKEEQVLEQKIFEITNYHREIYGVDNFTNKTLSGKIEELIRNLCKKYSQKVVILVDEYDYFTALCFDVRVEDVTNHGQVDMTVFFEDKVYVFEFKVLELTDANSALAQIKEKKYYEKHLTSANKEIYLVGVTFSRDNRNITNCEWEKIADNAFL